MKRKFTCSHCGKESSFDPNNVRKRVDLQERKDDPTDLVAYLPKCRFCGQITTIAPVMPHYSRSTSKKDHSAKKHKPKAAHLLPDRSTPKSVSFWGSKTVEELAAEQGVKPVEDPNDLQGDFWSEDEGADDFLTWLQALRREGKENR
jgi:hypothetical protein